MSDPVSQVFLCSSRSFSLYLLWGAPDSGAPRSKGAQQKGRERATSRASIGARSAEWQNFGSSLSPTSFFLPLLQRMYGKKYVWFFIGWYEDDWFHNEKYLEAEKINCNAGEMREAAEGHFTTEAQMWNQHSGILDNINQVTSLRFHSPLSGQGPFTYDVPTVDCIKLPNANREGGSKSLKISRTALIYGWS